MKSWRHFYGSNRKKIQNFLILLKLGRAGDRQGSSGVFWLFKVWNIKNTALNKSISKRSPNNNKKPKINKYTDASTKKRNNPGDDSHRRDKKELDQKNIKNQTTNLKEHSVFKDLINNKKLKKDIVNQKIKSQGSPKQSFLQKKLKKNNPEKVQQNDGK